MPVSKRFTIKDFYKSYPDRYYPRTPLYCEYSDYRKICEAVNKRMAKNMREEGFIYILPHRIGTLQVTKVPTNKYRVDYYNCKKHNTLVKYRNAHSSGHSVRWKWDKSGRKMTIRYKRMYTFKATRASNRELARLIKQQNTINKYI